MLAARPALEPERCRTGRSFMGTLEKRIRAGGIVAAAALAIAAAPRQEAEPPSRQLLRELCAAPRLAGTVGSLRAARWVAGKLEEAGWRVELEERVVLLSLPRQLGFELYAGPAAEGEEALVRRVECFDPDADPPGDVPAYNAWSASGEVRAPVVDVGYGLRADYARLAAAGIDVRGKVALARYGRSYRGVKVELAAEHGCAGILLFNDPAGDGDAKGPTWPEGPWKPDTEAQRGSISSISRAPGDPTTPGVPSPLSGVDGKRRSLEDCAADLPRIPCLPIGARDARAILARLIEIELPQASGEAVRAPVGPGPAEVRLALDVPRELRSIWNVIATLPGEDERVVVAGNHRDAWVRGANDAGSGTVALLRAAQRLGERAKAGWKPRHTLVLGFWDAEEFGLVGSTEWGEAHAERLRRDGLCYVNADAAVSGTRFGASGTPGLFGALRRALERVPAPGESRNLWEQWSAAEGGSPELSLPASGSDFAVFLHHLSLPVLDIGFHGNSGGQYHTRFDDFAMVERYLDPGFSGHELAGEFLAALLAELAGDHRFDAREAALEMAKVSRAAGAEPWLGQARGARLALAFEELAEAVQGWSEPWRFYARLELERGLPEREWFRNRLWAPGLETGYSAETFPTLRAAARSGEDALEAELAELAGSVRALAAELSAPIERPAGG
jgi:N-acetylated-alpha-linked acidic dipeptidase